ncbi:hypothetical protein Kpol_1020p47 [Vanderwaltozyma polyspora DSM 70294]|uniref:Ribose-5-phosphate isomerase n=1 Tax=Vanderwaltozyma polyspora (strain ATCC 22028 / DSM 70294 / BCRC 21397 / CBS 2163 / NBRC 10782 / NRRL Y-8283 / UCD 57-17) TaxID=436907 RepID=RPIA_VANPO|nr:uncharacterized protein Kpol_1020p47 [Vanderwaltozyma polyspora DSM 70294]A7TLF7.1 RecName: Full=Ribose-5-phosphate isomerase; AltName: Full=D-ribose-5-phosphate ketol-isomerase; AltName: Full=Phosphoriboisomerase [Vanderwaltozyma polyspora DSM 70294]EDO16938.1 hypothetical protein Kpol_1020p47 [Vanderwaltozyma polyspora DSM 70294]
MSSVPDIKTLPKLSNPLEDAKRLAAYRAVDENVDFQNERVIGIGSGSTVVYVAERLGQYLKDPKYTKYVSQFVCIPTGFQSRALILDNGLQLDSIDHHPIIDIAFDGADEVDVNLQLIKGGGACLFQEKLVSTSAKRFIVVADHRKQSPQYLGKNWRQGVPIEVVPSAYVRVQHDLLNKLHAQTAVVRQGGSAKAGPVVTDNNNFIIDADFGEIKDPKSLYVSIEMLIGVVEVGLFIDNAEKVYFGNADGSVNVLDKKN